MGRFLRNNGLSLAMFGLFLVCLVPQALVGHQQHNADQESHGESSVGLGAYLTTGHFVEAVFENWESEFLQMFGYVVLTVFLVQKGSPESKPVDSKPGGQEQSPPSARTARRAGLRRRIYEHSLSLVLLGLFLVSFTLHAAGGAAEYSQEQMAHGQPGISMAGYVTTSRFWFESLQNWQSEFLAVGALVVLSVYLRERGSPESNPVDTRGAGEQGS